MYKSDMHGSRIVSGGGGGGGSTARPVWVYSRWQQPQTRCFSLKIGWWVRMRTEWLSCFSQENILDFFNNFRLSH